MYKPTSRRPAFTHAIMRLLGALVLALLLPVSVTQARPALAGQYGVHVCSSAHFSVAGLLCTHTDRSLSAAAFASARLSITGRNGNSFTSNTLTLLLEMRTGQGDVELGRVSLDVGLADNVVWVYLYRAFGNLGVEPTVNTTYVIEADEEDGSQQVLLGTTVFTLRAAGAPAPSSTAGTVLLVVIKGFGAALRAYPSSYAPIETTLACGTQLSSFGQSAGWYHVQTANGMVGWVGGVRAVPMSSAPAYDCTGAVTYPVGLHVRTYVPTGCLSLRSTPSRQASYAHCVSNGHKYVIVNGPIEVAGEEWFGVFSPSTGSGWSLAQYLLPAAS